MDDRFLSSAFSALVAGHGRRARLGFGRPRAREDLFAHAKSASLPGVLPEHRNTPPPFNQSREKPDVRSRGVAAASPSSTAGPPRTYRPGSGDGTGARPKRTASVSTHSSRSTCFPDVGWPFPQERFHRREFRTKFREIIEKPTHSALTEPSPSRSSGRSQI